MYPLEKTNGPAEGARRSMVNEIIAGPGSRETLETAADRSETRRGRPLTSRSSDARNPSHWLLDPSRCSTAPTVEPSAGEYRVV